MSDVGQVSTVGMIEASVTRYLASSGLDMSLNPAVSVTIDGDVFPLSNDDFDVEISSTRFTVTSKLSPAVSIPALGVKFIGFIITRTGGASGSVNNTVTITNGTGGGEIPYNNNAISNIIMKL